MGVCSWELRIYFLTVNWLNLFLAFIFCCAVTYRLIILPVPLEHSFMKSMHERMIELPTHQLRPSLDNDADGDEMCASDGDECDKDPLKQKRGQCGASNAGAP